MTPLELKAREAAQSVLVAMGSHPGCEVSTADVDMVTECILWFATQARQEERERAVKAIMVHLRKKGDDAMESGYAEASFAFQQAANIVEELSSLRTHRQEESGG